MHNGVIFIFFHINFLLHILEQKSGFCLKRETGLLTALARVFKGGGV